MVKRSSTKTYKTKGGRHVRIGVKFHEALIKIRKKILIETNIDEISFAEITNIITRHNLWPKIFEDAGNVKEEEIMKYGNHQ